MRLRSLPSLLLAILALVFVLPSATEYYTDWLWFGEVGYQGIFLRSLNAQALVFTTTFAMVFAFVYGNLVVARRRAADRPPVVLGSTVDGRPIMFEGRRLAGLAVPVAAVLALLTAGASASNWLAWLTFFHGVPFGETDALFGRDVGFYVYRMPIYESVRQQALAISLLTLLGSAAYYLFSGSFVIEARPGGPAWPRVRLMPTARVHLSLQAALALSLLAWGAWLNIPNTLLSPAPQSVVPFGASYTDVYASIPFFWGTFAVLILGVGLAIMHGFVRRGWPLPLAVALYFGVTIGGGVYAAILQRLVVTPNEQNKERPFITHNIAATRAAYALGRVEERELSGDAELSASDIIANAGTIENVRLWDHQPLLQTFAQIQEIRTYYDFYGVDNDRYVIDGKYRQVMLSARELNTESMSNKSFVNERLTFTHGYGVTLGPVNEVTTEGLPVLFIKDLPPVSTKDLRLDEPSIYYGELSNNYVLVKTRTPEFHYPRGDNNETTFYAGTGGVPVGNLLRRAAFALRFASTDILVTSQLTSDTRIMFHRRIGDRVRLIAPFLTFDSDPYPVLSGGRLFWIQDAYTTTANYPFSTPVTTRPGARINYIRNSVKIVIDAYNGSVSFYLAEPDDPLAKTLDRIFPGMLRPLAEMPEGLRQHVRYPEDIFRYQSEIYRTYHMTNPQVFYNKEDQWAVPPQSQAQNASPMQPYYTIMSLPGEKKPEFIQMLPFTPRNKDNLAAWMVARSDVGHYGQLLVFQFPKNTIIYGPQQVNARISQNQLISPQITLWSQQGSEVIWGTLLVIPIKESLIYVRPLYLRAPDGRIPELKRVVVAYQDRIVMHETLTKALGEIFGPKVTAALAPDLATGEAASVVQRTLEGPAIEALNQAQRDPTLAALAAEGRQHIDRANLALKAGDLVAFCEEWKRLGEVFDKIDKITKGKQ
jgi:uncharacterized membrane protein (UPF0182 family)